jgi:hypothetical protein
VVNIDYGPFLNLAPKFGDGVQFLTRIAVFRLISIKS